MEFSTSSISNEIDKSIQEDFSVSQAAIDEIRKRRDRGQKPESISNEEIRKGDPILNTYKVLDDAIHGGMGSVWRVHHESWNVDLAMKRPQPRFFAEAGDGRKEEFIRECENWINLGLHPNIVSCYYVREIGGVPTIFSEWMDNGSLKDRIRDGSLYEGTEEEVQERILDIAIQTARGLKHSHDNNLIHQDVKPGNILLTKDWDAKVADFGLAKAQSQLTENEKPVSTGYTIQYCPREQAEGAPAEKWMDLYAWALTVLEMYAGKRLWETGAEAKEHPERWFEQLRVRMPEGVKSLLKDCLQHNQESGFCDFETAISALLQIYQGEIQRRYPKPPYKTTSASADNLNNYAMSMLDLRDIKAAENAWDEAIRQSPDHAYSIINRAFFLWHSAKLMDDDVLQIINTLPDGSEKDEALELFAMESGEKEERREGTVFSDVELSASGFAYDASFEGNEHVWLAMNDSLKCYDTKTGEVQKTIDKTQTGEKLTLVQVTEDGQLLYTGNTNTLLRIDLTNTDHIEKMTIKPDRKSMLALYPDGTGISGGKQYVYNPLFSKWHQIWLEKEDTILSVAEESEWEDPDDRKKYSRWLHSFPRPTPTPPTVKKVKEYCVLRFLLDSASMKLVSVQPIMNGEKKDWKRRDFLFRNCKTQGCKKPDDRWEALDGRLKDTATGRFIRSEKGIIKAFSPDRSQYLLISGTGRIGSENQARICRPPEKGAGGRLYTLSRIKDIATVQQEDETANTIYESFCRAFEGEDYKEAISSFQRFRSLPDQQDSERATEMELRLSNVCRRIRLHHYGMPAEKTEKYDMSVFNPGWIYCSGRSFQEYVKMSSTKHTKYETSAEKAVKIVESAFPIRYINEKGQSITLDSGRTGVILMNHGLTVAYVNVFNQGPAGKCALIEVNLNSGKIRVIASERGTPIIAPNGKTWVRTDMHGLHVYNGGMGNYRINIPTEQDFPLFSPDSGFILYRNNHAAADEYKLIATAPEKKDKEPYTVQTTVLPQLPKHPEGKSFRGVYFAGDGLHLMLVYGNGRINNPESSYAPWLRLSWDYALPETVNKSSFPLTEQQGKPEVPTQKQQEEKKKKGLFSRLFG